MPAKGSGTPRPRDLFVGVLAVQVAFALATAAALILDPAGLVEHIGTQILAGSLILLPVITAGLLALRFHRSHRAERIRARASAQLMDTFLSTSREWLWAVDDQWNFTFSSPTSASVLGYSHSELVGMPCAMIIDDDDFARARRAVQASREPEGRAWSGVVVRCRHRDGSAVWMEMSGTFRPARDRQPGGFEGTSRPLPQRPRRKQRPLAAGPSSVR